MKRLLLAATLAAIGAFCVAAQTAYQPPTVVSAGDAYIPYQIVLDGLFVLDVHLDKSGKIQKIDALRNPGAMLGAAESSVRGWNFQAASNSGEPAESRLTAVFVYRPANWGVIEPTVPPNFTAVVPPGNSARGYIPVSILSCAYPQYPVNSVAAGSVVVQVAVKDSGEATNVRFLHHFSGFDSLVLDALKKWRFRAASFHGMPVTADVVIAFVFQTPVT